MYIQTKHLHRYQTNAEFETAYNGSAYTEPWVSYIDENERVDYNKSEYEKLLGTPLTFEITSNGAIRWEATFDNRAKTIEYKKNSGEWTSITSATGNGAPSISVVAGDTVQFRGNNTMYDYNGFSGTTCNFKAKGNIMSMFDSTNYASAMTFQENSALNGIFSECSTLTDASKLMLPATTLTQSCYHYMFRDCTSLTAAPKLTASTLATNCYCSMFVGCTSLTTAPELPATTLAMTCYDGMFLGCTSLTTAPELPVTTLAYGCYRRMFSGCTNLTTAPELPAETLQSLCYENMFVNCSSLNYIKCLAINKSASNCTTGWVTGVASSGTFVKNASMSSWYTGNDGIPTNWTVQNA